MAAAAGLSWAGQPLAGPRPCPSGGPRPLPTPWLARTVAGLAAVHTAAVPGGKDLLAIMTKQEAPDDHNTHYPFNARCTNSNWHLAAVRAIRANKADG